MRFFTLLALAGVLAASPTSAQIELEGPSKQAQRTATIPTGPSIHAQPAEARSGALFFEGFETSTSGESPAGWGVDNANGDDQAWTAGDFGASTEPQRARTGSFAAIVFWNSAEAANDWLLSPGIEVTGGTSYTLTFWFKPGDAGFSTSESLEVRYGTGATVADMTTTLLDLDDVPAGDYQVHSATFTPTDDGTIHLGFQCNSAPDQYFCALDDITVDPTPAGPTLAVSSDAVDFGTVLVGESATETVTVSNTGGATLEIGSYILGAACCYTGASGASSLEPGESTTFEVTFTPETAEVVTAEVTLNSNDPASPTVVAFTGTGVVAPDNDNVDDATVVSGPGMYTGTNAFATLETDEPVPTCQDNQGASVWFSYTPSADETLFIDLSGSTFDTILTVYNGETDAEVACDDDGGAGLTSQTPQVEVTAGTTYFMRVAGFDATPFGGSVAQGDVSLSISSYDNSDPQTTMFTGGIDLADTFDRPSSDGDGSAGSCTTTAGVSFDALPITIAAEGPYQFTATWDGFDGYLLLYEGAFDATQPCLNLIARDDDFDPGTGSAAGGSQIDGVYLTDGSPTRGGGVYTLVMTTFDSGAAGAYSLEAIGPGSVSFPVAAEDGVDAGSALGLAVPNPTAGAVRLDLTLGAPEAVRVVVLDVLGREVAVVHDGPLAAGTTPLRADVSALPTGRYLVRATGATIRATRTVTVVR